MTVIGKHEQYREVKLVPAHLCCKIVCTETARCEHCQDPETGNDVLVHAKTPQPLFPHSYLSSSVIAEVLFEIAHCLADNTVQYGVLTNYL